MKTFLALLLFSPALFAADWLLIPEPKFMAHEITWPLPGSKETVLLPVRLQDGELVPLTVKDLANADLSREKILEDVRREAGLFLETLEPELVRDSRGVILYAVLNSQDPRLPSVVFAPGFAERFNETIGPDLLVTLPNRNRIYVFPKSAVPAALLSDQVAIDYRSTNFPISREIFELTPGGLSAYGILR